MRKLILTFVFIYSLANGLLFGQSRSYQNPSVASSSSPYTVKSVTIGDLITEITLEVTDESVQDITSYFPRNVQLKDNTNSRLYSLDSIVGSIHSKVFSVYFYTLPENTKSISIYGKTGDGADIAISNIGLGTQPVNENDFTESSDIISLDNTEQIETAEQSDEQYSAKNESETNRNQQPISKYKVTNTSTFLNIREYPNTNSAIIGKLKTGSIVDVYEISEGWAKIQIENKAGFISAKFLDKIDDSKENNGKFNFSLNLTDSIGLSSIFPDKGDHKNLAIIISALIFILFIASKFKKNKGHLDETSFLYIFNVIMILLITGLEITYFIIDVNPIWFCSPREVGWIMTIVNFLIFGFLVFQQISIYFDTFCDIRYNSYTKINLLYGSLSWPIGLILGIILSFFISKNLILIAFIAYQAGWIIFMFYKFASEGGIGRALLATIYYILATIGTFLILLHFTILFIFAFIAFIILQIIGSSSKSSNGSNRSSEEEYTYSVTDDRGVETKLKRQNGTYIGDDGSYWKESGYGNVQKDD